MTGDEQRRAAGGDAGGRRATRPARPATDGPATDGPAGLRAHPGGTRAQGLDGVLLVRKPVGPTSHDIVALVRRLAGTRRVGHGGTLDPFASGILPVFLGRATRLVEYHMADRKRYRATICFGASSTTDDLEGDLTPATGPAPDRVAVEAALSGFRGTIVQVPPAYSAVKVAGRRAYALARAGKTPEIAPRTVTIHHLDLVEWDGTDPERPIAIVDVGCSAGTYVRAIARDLGAALGSAAYLGALQRTASGPFSVEDAVDLDDLRGDPRATITRRLLPVDAGLDTMSVVALDADGIRAIERGQRIRDPHPASDGSTEGPAPLVRLRSAGGDLVAIGRREDGWVVPVKVLRSVSGAGTDD